MFRIINKFNFPLIHSVKNKFIINYNGFFQAFENKWKKKENTSSSLFRII